MRFGFDLIMPGSSQQLYGFMQTQKHLQHLTSGLFKYVLFFPQQNTFKTYKGSKSNNFIKFYFGYFLVHVFH